MELSRVEEKKKSTRSISSNRIRSISRSRSSRERTGRGGRGEGGERRDEENVSKGEEPTLKLNKKAGRFFFFTT
jgi:hypothetical protein